MNKKDHRTMKNKIVRDGETQKNPNQATIDKSPKKDSYPKLSENELEKLLFEWNYTNVDYPKDKCVHHLFEEQVERTPENIAVIYENDHATYAELNERANRLAHYLVKQGVKEESIVALFLERGIDMLASLLAISKAGATYLPLDPIYPKARLEMVLNDAQPVVCLTQKSLIDALPTIRIKSDSYR